MGSVKEGEGGGVGGLHRCRYGRTWTGGANAVVQECRQTPRKGFSDCMEACQRNRVRPPCSGVERGRHLVSNRARSGAVLPSTAVRAQRRLKPLQRVRDPRWIRAEHNRRVAAAAPGRHEDIFVRYKYLLYDKAGGAVALTLPTALLAVHLRAARGGRGGAGRGGQPHACAAPRATPAGSASKVPSPTAPTTGQPPGNLDGPSYVSRCLAC